MPLCSTRVVLLASMVFGCGGRPPPPPPAVAGPAPAVDTDPDPDVASFELVARRSTVRALGGELSEAWTYNGQFPGPTLQARVGDEVVVRFTNDLPEPTTIHWHGLRIADAMDGVPAIQEPVQPGETFTYRFTVPDAGTFWYHPHVRAFEQMERGLYGAIVVHPRKDQEGVNERVFLVDDVLLDGDGALAPFVLEEDHVTQSHGRVGSHILVNGLREPGRVSSTASSSERWRVINASNASPLRVSVQGGLARVIARDGGLLPDAVNTTGVDLPVGGRVDFEIRGPAGEATSLVVEPAPLAVGQPAPARAWVDWSSEDSRWAPWPFPEAGQILAPRQQVELTFDRAGGGQDRTWTINGAEWGEHEPIGLMAGQPTLIRLDDQSGAPHPFHLHGQFFRIVSRAGRPVEDAAEYDSIMLGPDEEVELYTLLDNPGRWMAHCHILAHAERGMMTEIVVRASEDDR